jgi:DNA (cytosine-5)-methyltransferase 1
MHPQNVASYTILGPKYGAMHPSTPRAQPQSERTEGDSPTKGDAVESRRPIAVDLFAGVGGMSLGFEQAGFDVVAAVEFDPVHAAAHSYNFPRTSVLCSNVANTSHAAILEAVALGHARCGAMQLPAEIDVVIGGPPCQGFSVGGHRRVEDPRNSLILAFAERVVELQPRYFVMENVPGLLRPQYAPLLDRAVETLSKGGYTIQWPPQALDAKSFGVPQSRTRLIVVGTRSGQHAVAYPTIERPTPTVWDAIGNIAPLCRSKRVRGLDEIKLTPRELAGLDPQASPYAAVLRESSAQPGNLAYRRNWDRETLSNLRPTFHSGTTKTRFAATKPGQWEPVSRYFRLSPSGVSPTLRAGTGSERGSYTSPRPIHPYQNRVITVREAARIHSFPDWFRCHVTNWHGFRQIGNAVPPQMAQAIATSILQGLALRPEAPKVSLDLGEASLLECSASEAMRMLTRHNRRGSGFD